MLITYFDTQVIRLCATFILFFIFGNAINPLDGTNAFFQAAEHKHCPISLIY